MGVSLLKPSRCDVNMQTALESDDLLSRSGWQNGNAGSARYGKLARCGVWRRFARRDKHQRTAGFKRRSMTALKACAGRLSVPGTAAKSVAENLRAQSSGELRWKCGEEYCSVCATGAYLLPVVAVFLP